MNEFHGNGLESFAASGFSSEEKAAARENQLTFYERAEKLEQYAEKIAHEARTAALVHGLLRHLGKIEFLTEEVCDEFAETHSDFFDEGPVVLAIAMALEKQKRSTH